MPLCNDIYGGQQESITKLLGTHLPRVNLQNSDSCFRVRRRELDLPIDTARPEQCNVEDVCDWRKTKNREQSAVCNCWSIELQPTDPVCSHDDLYISARSHDMLNTALTLIFFVGSNPSN